VSRREHNRRIFQNHDELIADRRNHPANRLGDDDVRHGLPVGHAEGLPLQDITTIANNIRTSEGSNLVFIPALILYLIITALARAGRANQANDFTLFDLQVDVLQDFQLAVMFGNMPNLVFIPALILYLIITALFTFIFNKIEKKFSVYACRNVWKHAAFPA